MPFARGNVTASFFSLTKDLPDDLLERFAAAKAGNLDTVGEEPQIGWVSGYMLLDSRITEETVDRGNFQVLNLRQASRRIPSAYLNALCEQEEYVYLKANNLEYVSRKDKKRIKEEVKEANLMKMPPNLSGIQVVIAPRAKRVFISATSTAQIDLFVEWFYKASDAEPYQLTGGQMLDEYFQITETSFPKLTFAPNCDDDPALGRDFLTWLWYYSETEGKIATEENGEFDILIEAPLSFARAAEAGGAADTVIKNGDAPSRSAEAKAALSVGKKLKKAKLQISREKQIWSGTFDADKFAFSGLKLPETEEMDAASIFEERMQCLLDFEIAIRAYFKKFAETMLAPDFAATQAKLQKWAADRDSL